jgi:peptidoglycan/LPS O-acetylase OafA/YrhL
MAFKPLVRLGVISYSFYLWHLTIVEFIAFRHSTSFSATGFNLVDHVQRGRTALLFLISLVVTGMIASVSYSLIELPFLRLKVDSGLDVTANVRRALNLRILRRR